MSMAARAGMTARVRQLGPTAYETTWRAMQAFTAARTPSTPDELWLTEHPPIYTWGSRGVASTSFATTASRCRRSIAADR